MKILTVLVLLLCVATCSTRPPALEQEFRSRSNIEQDPDISLSSFQVDDFTLRYASTNHESTKQSKLATVVFIHGTPGSWRSLGRLMTRSELKQAARLVSIDRPGWGGSLFDDKRSEPDFAAQSILIEPFLRQLKQESNNAPLILVGHSYGGSIAPYLAYRNPDLVDGVLMAASAIDPELGKPRWYNYAASVWPITRLIDERLAIANDEIWGVAPALKELEPWWKESGIPLVYVQGENDELVHPENFNFAERYFPKETSKVIQLADQGHLLHVQQRDLLSQLTLELLESVENNLN